MHTNQRKQNMFSSFIWQHLLPNHRFRRQATSCQLKASGYFLEGWESWRKCFILLHWFQKELVCSWGIGLVFCGNGAAKMAAGSPRTRPVVPRSKVNSGTKCFALQGPRAFASFASNFIWKTFLLHLMLRTAQQLDFFIDVPRLFFTTNAQTNKSQMVHMRLD